MVIKSLKSVGAVEMYSRARAALEFMIR